jgi:TolB protein
MKLLITTLTFIFVSLFTVPVCAQTTSYKEVQLTNNNYDDRYPSYNKAGEVIVFESNRNGKWQIYTMDVNGNNVSRVITSNANDRRPTWHPFKNMILFESDRTGINELYTYNISERTLKKVPIDLKGNKMYGQFAPNGAELVFNYKVRDNNYNIYIISKNGKRRKKIFDNAFENTYPRYTRRGEAILYFSKKNTKDINDEVYVYNIILKKEKRLTVSTIDNNFASWSNNGARIAYSSIAESGNQELFFMNKDGSSKRQITFNSGGSTLPNWSPKDINVLITGRRNGHDQICKILLKEEIIIDDLEKEN